MMWKRVTSVLLCVVLLTGCTPGIDGPEENPTKLTDRTNYNFTKENVTILEEDGSYKKQDIFTHKENNRVDIYLDTCENMGLALKSSSGEGAFRDLIDAVVVTWDKPERCFYQVQEGKVTKAEGTADLDNPQNISFQGLSDGAIQAALDDWNSESHLSGEKIIQPKLKLIVTDFQGQLSSYRQIAQGLCDALSDRSGSQHRSLAVISVKTEGTNPIFIFAIGWLRDLSDFLESFYNMPAIRSMLPQPETYSVQDHDQKLFWFEDEELSVNCKLYAQNCGIYGIDYYETQGIEKGLISRKKNGTSKQSDVVDPDDPADVVFDPNGSYSILRANYCISTYKDPADSKKTVLDVVEGTVNFREEVWDDPSTRPLDVKLPENVSDREVSEEDIRCIAFCSLLWPGAEDAVKQRLLEEGEDALYDELDLAGKIKIRVKFNMSPLVAPLNYKFSMEPQYFTGATDQPNFESVDAKKIEDNLYPVFATSEESDKDKNEMELRLDNVNKTAVINIMVKHLNRLADITKLDIRFRVIDPGTIPQWVSSLGDERFENFFVLMNSYSTKMYAFEDTLTVYIVRENQEQSEIETSFYPA